MLQPWAIPASSFALPRVILMISSYDLLFITHMEHNQGIVIKNIDEADDLVQHPTHES